MCALKQYNNATLNNRHSFIMNQESFENYSEPEEIEIEAIGIDVSSQPIELYKLFKVANLVGGGGEAKHVITEGYVAVNGELEIRKRRKMYDGDFFEFNQEYYVVVCDQPPMEEAPHVLVEDNSNASKGSKLSSSAKSKKQGRDSKTNNSKAKSAKSKPTNSKQSKPKNSQPANKSQQRQGAGAKDPNSGRGSIDFF